MGKNSIGLSVLLGMAKYVDPTNKTALDRLSAQAQNRPKGSVFWFHVGDISQALALSGLMHRLCAARPDVTILLTSKSDLPFHVLLRRLPKQMILQPVPKEAPKAIANFLEHWCPDACIWAQNSLRPVLIAALWDRGVPSIFANAQLAERSVTKMRWMPGISGELLNKFNTICPISEGAARQFRRFGVTNDRLGLVGALRFGTEVLPNDDRLRTKISRKLKGRQCWIATHVDSAELADVLRAQKTAARSVHRLLLVLSAGSKTDPEHVMNEIENAGLNVVQCNDVDAIDDRIDVVIITPEDVLGVWYRVAAVAFMGRSLTTENGSNPLEAAALGSAVVHGPHVDDFADIYAELQQAGGAIEVATVASLAEAVSELSAPDKAAKMAHAAWEVSSNGAEVLDQMEALLYRLIEGEDS